MYVDGILLIGNNIQTLQEVKYWIGKCFAMKDLGEATYIIGRRIYRNRQERFLGLGQSAYLDKILKRFSIENSKKGDLPMHHTVKLSKAQCPSSDKEM